MLTIILLTLSIVGFVSIILIVAMVASLGKAVGAGFNISNLFPNQKGKKNNNI